MVQGFPVGPYKLRGKFVFYRALAVGVCALLALGCVVGYVSMAWDSASLILHDQRIWNAGGAELPAGVDGDVTTRQFVLSSYDLKVHYRTADGRVHEQPLKLDTLGSLPDEQSPTVRLAPDSADDFALSSAVAASGKRWASAALFGVVGTLLIGGLFGFLAYASSIQWRRARHAARHGVPLRCQLLGRERLKNNAGRDLGIEKVTFRIAELDRPPLDVMYQFRTKGSDVLTLDGGAAVLALVPPAKPQAAILMLRDFYPIELGQAERSQAEQAVGQR